MANDALFLESQVEAPLTYQLQVFDPEAASLEIAIFECSQCNWDSTAAIVYTGILWQLRFYGLDGIILLKSQVTSRALVRTVWFQAQS